MFGVVKPDKIKRSGHFVMPFVSTGIVGVRVGLAGGLSKFRYSEGEISKKRICLELFLFEQAVISQPVCLSKFNLT